MCVWDNIKATIKEKPRPPTTYPTPHTPYTVHMIRLDNFSLLCFCKRSIITSQLILGNCQGQFLHCFVNGRQTPEGRNRDRTNYRAALPWSNQNYYMKTAHSPVYYSVCVFTEESGSCCVREWDVINCFQKFGDMSSWSSAQRLFWIVLLKVNQSVLGMKW